MKIVPMRIDYTNDIRTMCEYLLRCDLHDPYHINSEELIGRFQVGRASGHTTALKDVANSFRVRGLRVVEVYGNRAELQGRSSSEVLYYGAFDVRNSHGVHTLSRNGEDMPDLIMFDAYSHFAPRLRGVEEGIDRMIHILHRGMRKRTVFFFVQ